MKKYVKSIVFASLLAMSSSFLCFGETLTINGVGTFTEVVTKEQINDRIIELGSQIDQDYANVQDSIVFIGVLNGCLPFLADLMRSVKHLSRMETIRVSSYHGGVESSGTIQFKYCSTLYGSLEGKHIIIVDDIIDTGLTMNWIVNYFKGQNPASIKIATLVLKKDCQKEETLNIDYIGFTRSPEFLIGCGLDYNEEYRNLPGIWARNEN